MALSWQCRVHLTCLQLHFQYFKASFVSLCFYITSSSSSQIRKTEPMNQIKKKRITCFSLEFIIERTYNTHFTCKNAFSIFFTLLPFISFYFFLTKELFDKLNSKKWFIPIKWRNNELYHFSTISIPRIRPY